MAETPELKRIAANTKIQSNVNYHADFEASKGKFTQVADDPEILRIKQNTKIISNVAYHGELQRKVSIIYQYTNEINEFCGIVYLIIFLQDFMISTIFTHKFNFTPILYLPLHLG